MPPQLHSVRAACGVKDFIYMPLLMLNFLSPFRLLCCLRNYKTIAGGFNPERVPCYPCNRKEIAIVTNYFVIVSALALHHHTAGIISATLGGAWVGICFVKVKNIAAIVSIDKKVKFYLDVQK